MGMKKLCITLPEQTEEWLRAAKKKTGLTVSDILRRSLDEFRRKNWADEYIREEFGIGGEKDANS